MVLFPPKQACVTYLLECQDLVKNVLCKHPKLDVLYSDFRKAFDKVSYRKFIHKLKAYGFGYRLTELCQRSSDWQKATCSYWRYKLQLVRRRKRSPTRISSRTSTVILERSPLKKLLLYFYQPMIKYDELLPGLLPTIMKLFQKQNAQNQLHTFVGPISSLYLPI